MNESTSVSIVVVVPIAMVAMTIAIAGPIVRFVIDRWRPVVHRFPKVIHRLRRSVVHAGGRLIGGAV
jgi:hypothetical protein